MMRPVWYTSIVSVFVGVEAERALVSLASAHSCTGKITP
jgi:hypothetical protein